MAIKDEILEELLKEYNHPEYPADSGRQEMGFSQVSEGGASRLLLVFERF